MIDLGAAVDNQRIALVAFTITLGPIARLAKGNVLNPLVRLARAALENLGHEV